MACRYPGIPHGIHRLEVRHVGEPDGGLQQLLTGRTGFLEQGIDPRESIAGLVGDIVARFADLPGQLHGDHTFCVHRRSNVGVSLLAIAVCQSP
jgi:hypothetical protein